MVHHHQGEYYCSSPLIESLDSPLLLALRLCSRVCIAVFQIEQSNAYEKFTKEYQRIPLNRKRLFIYVVNY